MNRPTREHVNPDSSEEFESTPCSFVFTTGNCSSGPEEIKRWANRYARQQKALRQQERERTLESMSPEQRQKHLVRQRQVSVNRSEGFKMSAERINQQLMELGHEEPNTAPTEHEQTEYEEGEYEPMTLSETASYGGQSTTIDQYKALINELENEIDQRNERIRNLSQQNSKLTDQLSNKETVVSRLNRLSAAFKEAIESNEELEGELEGQRRITVELYEINEALETRLSEQSGLINKQREEINTLVAANKRLSAEVSSQRTHPIRPSMKGAMKGPKTGK